MTRWGSGARALRGGTRRAATAKPAGRWRVALPAGCGYVHTKQEPFSYEGYRFTQAPVVNDVALSSFLRKPAVRLLAAEGIETSQQLADSFFAGKLASIQGFGETSINEVKAWIANNRVRRVYAHSKDLDSTGVPHRVAKVYQLDDTKRFEPKASAPTAKRGRTTTKPKTTKGKSCQQRKANKSR
jgi:hypothetical protein